MSTSEFVFPVTGITGPSFRDGLREAFEALASTHRSAGELPKTYPGMIRVLEGPPDSLQVRDDTDSAWVTLMPDLSEEFGGLLSVTGAGNLLTSSNNWQDTNTFNADSVFKTTATFDSTVLFKGNVTFDNNPGFSTPAQTTAAINTAIAAIPPSGNFGSKSFTANPDPGLNSQTTLNHGFGEVPKLVTVDVRLQRNKAGYDDNQVLLGSQFSPREWLEVSGVRRATGFTVRFDSQSIQIATGEFLEVVDRNDRRIKRLDDGNDFAYVVKAYA